MKLLTIGLLGLLLLAPAPAGTQAQGRGGPTPRDLIYVAVPGRVNDIGYGGIGILVFDVNRNFRFVNTTTKTVIAQLKDEIGREVQSEKAVEIVFNPDGKPIKTVDQFGVGQVRTSSTN